MPGRVMKTHSKNSSMFWGNWGHRDSYFVFLEFSHKHSEFLLDSILGLCSHTPSPTLGYILLRPPYTEEGPELEMHLVHWPSWPSGRAAAHSQMVIRGHAATRILHISREHPTSDCFLKKHWNSNYSFYRIHFAFILLWNQKILSWPRSVRELSTTTPLSEIALLWFLWILRRARYFSVILLRWY